MLAIPELWDTCQWELLIGCKNNLREEYVVVSKVVKSWGSEELSDIKHGGAKYGVGPAGFRSLVQYFLAMLPSLRFVMKMNILC